MKRVRSFFQPVRDGHLSPDNYSLQVVISYTALVGFGGHFLFIFMFAWLGVSTMALVNIASCAIFLLCYGINRRGFTHLALLLGASEVVLHAILAVAYIGWDSNFHYYIIGLVPLIFYSRQWHTSFKTMLAAILCSGYIALYLFTRQATPWHELNSFHIYIVSSVNILTLFIVFSALAHYYLSAATFAENALKRANQKLEYLAHTDPLTKLLNRRNMVSDITSEINTFALTGRPFSVIIGDIDNFKKYNDRYGHEAGDLILVKVAETMQNCVRNKDRVARWGGEEFLILLPDTDQEIARSVAERLRESIANTKMQTGDVENQITMTFGVSTYSGYTEATECIRRADLAMYQGKHQGKNCVIVHPDNKGEFVE